jgi:predicted esterase
MSAKNILVPTIMIHGKSDSLVPVTHSQEIIKFFHHKTIKKLLEVEGDHNDYRDSSDVNIVYCQ